MKLRFFMVLAVLIPVCIFGDDFCRTSFEQPEFIPGSVSGQNAWSVLAGGATVSLAGNSAYSGEQSLLFSVSGSSLKVNYTPFTSQSQGPGGVIYIDMFIRIDRLEEKYFAVSGYDLYGGSEKRTFVFEFNTPSGLSGIFNICDGSSKKNTGNWTTNEWNRISARIDFNNESYQVIFNGGDYVTASFRESYSPPVSPVRPDGEKQFHQIRFNLGYDAATGSADAFVDDLYIGSDPIPDIVFEQPDYFWTVNVDEPVVGSIYLNPAMENYPDSTWVTATLHLPKGYLNQGWTGDLSGTDTTMTFLVTGNMTIGAEIGIDTDNPPDTYTIMLIQPETGYINLEPAQDLYYAYSRVTARINIPAGYIFAGWTGDLTGNDEEITWQILQNMTIGALVVNDTIPGTIYTVSSASEFKTLCQSTGLHPGDVIELSDGNYNTGGITIKARGTENKPIIIRAQNRGQTVLNGDSYFSLRESEFVTIEGFEFTSDVYTVIKLEACNNVRITRNTFHLTESEDFGGKWILIGGIWNDASKTSHHNRIDYNLFENKHKPGNFITIDGGDVVSQYDVIAYNHFRNIGPRRENEMETIRVGVSGMSLTDGFTLIERNLFESCDGDPEIISIKSCKDTVRYNTFIESQGTVCLRQGNGSVVDGNFFFGHGKTGTGGVRVYGRDHTIVNNYFENLTGYTWDAAVTLTNGDVSSGAENAHWQIQNAKILMNTFVNNKSTIEIGYPRADNTWKKVPVNLLFYGNLIFNGDNPAITYLSTPQNIVWQKNIAYDPDETYLGIDAEDNEVWVVNPLLQESDGLFQPSAASPALAYLDSLPWTTDLMGLTRSLPGDCGAVEHDGTGNIFNIPLTENAVGPYAENIPVSVKEERSSDQTPVVPDIFSLSAYPNPFNGSVSLSIRLLTKEHITIDVFSLDGRKVITLNDAVHPAGIFRINWVPENIGSGVYLIRAKSAGNQKVLKILYVK